MDSKEKERLLSALLLGLAQKQAGKEIDEKELEEVYKDPSKLKEKLRKLAPEE